MKAMTQHIGSSKYTSPLLQISDLEGVTGIGNQKDEWTHKRHLGKTARMA